MSEEIAAERKARRTLRLWSFLGWLVHGLFLTTVYFLYGFLRGYDAPPPPGTSWDLLLDGLLAVQFAIPHSWLLMPTTRARLTRWIPSAGYGLFFCMCTCVSLLLTIACWRPCGNLIWQLDGLAKQAMLAAFFASWAALFYSLHLTGLGYQTGWTTWRHWMRGEKIPPREFSPRGAYRILRHPVYLSFLGLIWFTPVLTFDRALLVAIWTAYIAIGSYLKDRRLVYYLGERYRRYQADVPGYPGLILGPLARIPRTATSHRVLT